MCCGGRFLTEAQRSYPFQGEESDPVPAEKYPTSTSRILHLYFSKFTTSSNGIYAILGLWALISIMMIYGIS